jgi:HNH endonuclease
MEKPFPIEHVKSAILAIAGKLTERQRQMLRMHGLEPLASMGTIAQFGDYDSYNSANLHYSNVGRKIADELGYSCPYGPTETIATVSPVKDSDGHSQWRMDDVIVKALEEIGWVVRPDKARPPADSLDVTETERETLRKERIVQSIFRSRVIALWGSCAVTGCSLSTVLVASHIVPWASCATNAERVDPFNGLLLTPNLDKLVDRCFIAFNDDGSILLSKGLAANEIAILGVNEASKLRFVPPAMLPYLQRHRQLFLDSEN